jgi:competence protein ComFC
LIAMHPQKLLGSWAEGFALDHHTLSSHYIGDDEFGHPQFDTQRSEVGELLYRLKFKGDMSVLRMLVEAAAYFVRSQNFPVQVVVAVPPSRAERPVLVSRVLADSLAQALGLPACSDCIVKVKGTPEIKNVRDPETRSRELDGAYRASPQGVTGKTLLLVDDLYRSGATLNAVTQALHSEADVQAIYVVTLTKTRSLR